jgi:isopenicillin-N epimerase
MATRQTRLPEPDWQAVRREVLLDDDLVYLNTGSYGIVARQVFDHVTALRRQMQSNPVDFLWRRGGELLRRARRSLAEFIGCPPSQVVFTDNVTTAMNLVAASLRVKTPGEILLSDHEYPAIRFTWERAAQQQGLRLRYARLPVLPESPEEIVTAFARELRPATRILFFSHVLYTTGMVLPAQKLCDLARQAGIVSVIDGAHAPGMLDLDLTQIGCDFYGANLHKWLLAPVGAGFLYVRPGMEDRILPLTVSWGWYYDRARAFELNQFGGSHWQRSFEFAGSRDVTPWLVVPEAVDFLRNLGWENIRMRQRELASQARARLDARRGLKSVTPTTANLSGAITAYRLPDTVSDPQALRAALWERFRIEINMIEHQVGPFLRVSTHFYNSEHDLDMLAQAVDALLA